jgi:hypothetical protein
MTTQMTTQKATQITTSDGNTRGRHQKEHKITKLYDNARVQQQMTTPDDNPDNKLDSSPDDNAA